MNPSSAILDSDTQQIKEDLSMVTQALSSSDDNTCIHRMIVAWGNATTALILLMATPIFLIVAAIIGMSGNVSANKTLIVGASTLIPILILFFLALPFLISAFGLFEGKQWGAGAAVVSAVFNILVFPLGTALAIYTFISASKGRLRHPTIHPKRSSIFTKQTLAFMIAGTLILCAVSCAAVVMVKSQGLSDLATSGINITTSNGGNSTITANGSNNDSNVAANEQGVVKKQKRAVANFQALTINVPARVYLSQGEPTCEIEADSHVLPLITTNQNGKSLMISIKPNHNIHTKNPIIIRLTTKDVSSIHLNGSVNLVFKNITSPSLTIVTSGASKISGSGTCDQLSSQVQERR